MHAISPKDMSVCQSAPLTHRDRDKIAAVLKCIFFVDKIAAFLKCIVFVYKCLNVVLYFTEICS